MIDPTITRLTVMYANASRESLEYGSTWYQRAHNAARRMARRNGVSRGVACDVIAALSPRNRWATNLTWADEALSGERTSFMRAHALNLARALKGERLSGPKVSAFRQNLRGNYRPVTVDVWAGRAAGIEGNPANVGVYREIERAYQRAADVIGIPPAILQATCWIEIRGSGD